MLFQEHREKHLDVALVLLQGKHPHYPQSSSVVTQVCYNPTKLGNLPVHAENRVISKPKAPSCGWELGGASDLCWLLTPSIRTCCCLTEPLETFQNLWEIVKRCLQVFASHYHTHSPCLPATKYLRRDHFKWQYLLSNLCWRRLGWDNYWQGFPFCGENQATSKK